jgi:hypothetical protein
MRRIHRKHQARDAREAIAHERAVNRQGFARTTELFRLETKRWNERRDLASRDES